MPNGRPPFPGRRLAAAGLVATAAAAACAEAAGADGFTRDRTPLSPDVGAGGATTAVSHASGGGTGLRLVLGLALVLALIWIVRLVVRRSSRAPRLRSTGGAISVVASAPLGPTRAVHLVAVGDELFLVGSADQAVTPIRAYDAAEARALLDVDDLELRPPTASGGGFGARVVDDLRRRTAR